ncbi:MAG: class I SAM-dependent methyltransferase [Flavobacteriales bacterium]
MGEREKRAKIYFSEPARYLREGYNLRIRRECVQQFTSGRKFTNVLDAPCGDASISLPLLYSTARLTLVDFSSEMLEVASGNIPSAASEKVELICSDIGRLNLPYGQYDLLLCLGLLSHVADPLAALDALLPLLKPGGFFILQNTDATHWYSRLIRLYEGLKGLFRRHSYRARPVPASLIMAVMDNHGLSLQKEYCYNQSFLGLGRLFSSESKYRLTQRIFGTPAHPRRQALGSDHIYLFVSGQP